ncbi:hypothetical protein ABH968_001132 [Lysinibacillus sp. RC79]
MEYPIFRPFNETDSLGVFFMHKNDQRTGIFDLENMNSIELKTINPKNEKKR